MSNTVIKIENLSKIYRLGEVGTGTLSHDLNRWVRMNILGQEDPYAKVGHVNDRTQKAEKGELVAALRDINLEVKEGEVLGIIGKNGAGKSTLLKLLSRVTSPTTGSIKVKGRLASLLEVGTGFHPEMTGRENIYLNGTIMGMRKWEIDRKLDEIVEFAGVAKYLDTPVKRYSSGMTVRLGFAVAAHLEPEILVVDEVLAVGDDEFQKKAIGKMQDVSKNDGRTVLFVSHNMAAVKRLCHRSILLEQGGVNADGQTDDIINLYLNGGLSGKFGVVASNYPRNNWIKDKISIKEIWLKSVQNENIEAVHLFQPIIVETLIEGIETIEDATLIISIGDINTNWISYSDNTDLKEKSNLIINKGLNKSRIKINQTLLPGKYFLNVTLLNTKGYPYDGIYHFGEFIVTNFSEDKQKYTWYRPLGSTYFNSEIID